MDFLGLFLGRSISSRGGCSYWLLSGTCHQCHSKNDMLHVVSTWCLSFSPDSISRNQTSREITLNFLLNRSLFFLIFSNVLVSRTLTLPVNIYTWKKKKPCSPGARKFSLPHARPGHENFRCPGRAWFLLLPSVNVHWKCKCAAH